MHTKLISREENRLTFHLKLSHSTKRLLGFFFFRPFIHSSVHLIFFYGTPDIMRYGTCVPRDCRWRTLLEKHDFKDKWKAQVHLLLRLLLSSFRKYVLSTLMSLERWSVSSLSPVMQPGGCSNLRYASQRFEQFGSLVPGWFSQEMITYLDVWVGPGASDDFRMSTAPPTHWSAAKL